MTARRDGERVLVAVEDDGPGFDGRALPEGHGLDTLRGRIAALYGAAGALEVEAVERGARVVMRLPAKAREAA